MQGSWVEKPGPRDQGMRGEWSPVGHFRYKVYNWRDFKRRKEV